MTDPTPSKTVLLERRGERDIVQEGKSVLEERRDLLARLMWEQIVRVERLENELQPLLKQARTWSRRAIARHGLAGLTGYKVDMPVVTGGQWQAENRLGTPWLERSDADHECEGQPSAQAPRASLELEETKNVLLQLLDSLNKLAGAEGNLLRLTHGFRRTQRRVNSLEHIILPELEESIIRIQSAMDEVERDDLVRASLIKRRQSD